MPRPLPHPSEQLADFTKGPLTARGGDHKKALRLK